MAADPTQDVSLTDRKQRLAELRDKIGAYNASGRGARSGRARIDATARTGVTAVRGTEPGARRRTRTSEANERSDARPTAPDTGSTWQFRDSDSGRGAIGSGTERKRSDSTPADRQAARPSSLTLPNFGAPVSWFLEHAVRPSLQVIGIDTAGSADPLSDEEVADLTPKVAKGIQGFGGGLDWSLTHLNRAREESYVWQFSDAEADILARIFLTHARHVGWLAKSLRQTDKLETVSEYRSAGFIIGKRVAASGLFIQQNGGVQPWLVSQPK